MYITSCFLSFLSQLTQAEIESLKQSGASDAEIKSIIAAHQRDLQNLNSKMEADKMRVQTSLKERLEKKRQERLASKQKQLARNTDDKRRELHEYQQSELQRLNADEVGQVTIASQLSYNF